MLRSSPFLTGLTASCLNLCFFLPRFFACYVLRMQRAYTRARMRRWEIQKIFVSLIKHHKHFAVLFFRLTHFPLFYYMPRKRNQLFLFCLHIPCCKVLRRVTIWVLCTWHFLRLLRFVYAIRYTKYILSQKVENVKKIWAFTTWTSSIYNMNIFVTN